MSELEQVVRADLTYLRDTWCRPGPFDQDTIRRDSASLRRLLIDEDFRKVARLKGEKKVWIVAPDLDGVVVGRDLNGLRLIAAGGATAGAVTQGRFVAASVGASDELLRTLPPCQLTNMTLSDFLASSACIAQENGRMQKASRKDVIQYVANKLGGAHYDEARRRGNKDSGLLVLDRLNTLPMTGIQYTEEGGREGTGLGIGTYVYSELMSIGQCLVASDLARRLLGG